MKAGEVKTASIGWPMARVTKSRSDVHLEIMTPADNSDESHVPAVSVAVWGKPHLTALRDLLNDVLADDEG